MKRNVNVHKNEWHNLSLFCSRRFHVAWSVEHHQSTKSHLRQYYVECVLNFRKFKQNINLVGCWVGNISKSRSMATFPATSGMQVAKEKCMQIYFASDFISTVHFRKTDGTQVVNWKEVFLSSVFQAFDFPTATRRDGRSQKPPSGKPPKPTGKVKRICRHPLLCRYRNYFLICTSQRSLAERLHLALGGICVAIFFIRIKFNFILKE